MSDQELHRDELEAVSSYMREVAAAPVRAVPQPSAALVWWKAELKARRDRQRRVVASLELMEAVQVLVAAVGATPLVALGWQHLAVSPTASTWAAAVLTTVTLAAATLLAMWGYVRSCALTPTRN